MKERDTVCGDCVRCDRDREPTKKFERHLQVRYMKSLRGKLSPYTCDQKLCPVMKERLHRHQVEHHPQNRKGSKTLDRGVSVLKFDEDLIVTPIINPNIENGAEKPKSVQTDTSINKNVDKKNVSLGTTHADDGTTQTDHIPLKRSETIEVLTPNGNFYREYVRNEINDWIRDVPTYQNANAKMTKDNLTNELLEDIITLSNNIQDSVYDSRLKFIIDNCLDKLPLLIPGAKHDQDHFKEDLTENLFNKIKELNAKLLNYQSVDKVSASKSTDSFDVEISEWLTGIDLDENSTNITKESVADLLLNRLRPILDMPMNTTNYKLKIKAEIVGILNDLPIRLKNTGNKFVYLNRFAEDLAVRLLSIQCRRRRHSYQYNVQIDYQKSYDAFVRQSNSFHLRYKLNNKLKDCLQILNIKDDNIAPDITNLLIDNIDLIQTGHENTIENYITELVYDTCNFTESHSGSIADYILKTVKEVMDEHGIPKTVINPQLSGIISVYTSNLLTSTPKRAKKEKTQLTPNETNYTQNIADLARSWVDTLPESKKVLNDKEYKEIVINDLAGSVMDTMKLHQLLKDTKKEEEHIRFITYVWILKFNIFANTDDAEPFVKDFYNNLKKIPVPDLTKSISGSRHITKKREFTEKSHPQMTYFPEKLDLIEDQISIWMNEQPSEIYSSSDKTVRNKMIHEVAGKLQVQLKNKNPKQYVKTTVSKFLSNIMKSKVNINELSDSLSERITKLPDEKYLENEKKTQRIFREGLEEKCCINEDQEIVDEDANKTVKEIVSKYIQHFYDIDDSVARGAFEHLLRDAILSSEPATGNNVYERLTKNEPDVLIDRELIYISMISDWLKNIPVDKAFNTTGNPRRIKFINTLSRELQGFDAARNRNPDWNYENEFVAIIHGYINLLPLQENQEQNIPYMINQLQKRIFVSSIQQDGSLDNSILHEHNLGDFIEEYVLTKSKTIADDEVKLDAWMARLMKEIRKIAREDPNALTKSHVDHRLEGIPIPTEECVKIFELQLLYVKEISEWLRNLPLLPLRDENDEQARIDMVSDLSEKLSQRKYKQDGKSDTSQVEKELVDYISTWISKLPLDSNKEVIKPILIKQLMTRINNIDDKEETPITARRDCVKQDSKKRDSVKRDFMKKDTITKNPINKKKTVSKAKQDIVKLNPGQMVVDAVENWLKNLPIEADEKTVKYIKDDYAKRLFKKVGEINTNPKIFGDNDLYQNLLNEEIDSQLDAIPPNNKIGIIKDKIKSDFINAILEARNIMKQKSAGDEYVHRLINILDTSIPNPVDNKQIHDPGFEIYKNKLANLFILSNFDHCNDDFKLPFEKKIREEVDKYVTHAVNRNAIPLTKDQINNELFSALFKVPMPNEESILKEVEAVKTKLVVDGWYDELPLEEACYGLTELLERDKILSTLAKRICELEREEAPAENILKEIKKWMTKFPFNVKFRCKLDFYASKLFNKLNSTKEERKCSVKDTKCVKGKGKRDEKQNYHISLTTGLNDESDSTRFSNVTSCCQLANFEERNPVELIVEMVEVWFEKLPVQANEEYLKILKTDAVTKIVLKISELNANPNILYDNRTYYALVNQELDEVLSNLPLRCDFPSTSDYKKGEFIFALQNIKPLIEDEKARHEYKKELKDTVNNILEPPTETSEEKSARFNNFKDELVEEFVQYYYNKEDEKGRQFYKNKVHDTILKYIQEVLNKNENIDPLILRNQLICELEKIPIPSETALKHNVEEIRMKEEVAAFLNENSMTPANKVQEQIRTILAKKLYEIERTGHTCDNDRKITAEIFKSIKKLGKELTPDKVEAFLNRLKVTESFRKAPPPRNVDARLHQTLNRSHPNNAINLMPIQNEYPSGQGILRGAQFVTSRRQTGPPPPLATSQYSMFQFHEPSYESGCVHNTNPSLMNIDHLVRAADRRWRDKHEGITNRPVQMPPGATNYITGGAQPHPTVDFGFRQMEMQKFKTSLPYGNQNIQMTGPPMFDRGAVLSTVAPGQALSSQSLQAIPCGQIPKLPQNVEVSPNHLAYGPVNLSCRQCEQPCPLRIHADQVDPCNTGRPSCWQSVQNNRINNSVYHQSLQNINPSRNVIDQADNRGIGPSQSTGAVMNATYITVPEQIQKSFVQGLENNSCHTNAPYGTPLQIQPQLQSVHESFYAPQVPPCCQNAQASAVPIMLNRSQIQIPESSRQVIVGANISMQTCSQPVIQESPVTQMLPCQPIPSIPQTEAGSSITPAGLYNVQLPNNEILNRSMTRDARTEQVAGPGKSKRQLPRKRVKLMDSRERPKDGQREHQEVDDDICKCGQRRRRNRRQYYDDIEMRFGRLPKCFYY